jgi:hypothetical protein
MSIVRRFDCPPGLSSSGKYIDIDDLLPNMTDWYSDMLRLMSREHADLAHRLLVDRLFGNPRKKSESALEEEQ